MRALLSLALCLTMVGCYGGEIKIPKKTIMPTPAEANEAYDTGRFTKINIPRNCKAVGITDQGRVLLENGSGTQFILTAPNGGFGAPAKIVADMPELW